MSAQPQPMGSLIGLLLCLHLLTLTGCSHNPVNPVSDKTTQSPLQRWTEQELAPYLAQQFTRHPRFKGEPVVLVRLQGSDISPEIDDLTRSLRDQIRDFLLSTGGIRLPWQPQRPQAQHHRRPEGAHCGRGREAAYFVGIDIGRTAADEYRVSVRALDVQAGEWVGGFGKRWVGSLTANELLALGESQTDESLRGLRVLPFGSGQSDLAAAYLANNLSCLLRQQADADLLLFVEPNPTGKDDLSKLLTLIGNNLSRYREVRVTDAKKEANLLLRGEAHEVQPGLFQVWTVLHPKSSGEHLAGVDTATYIRFSGGATPTAWAPRNARERPARPELKLVRPRLGNWSKDGCLGSTQETCRVLELSVEDSDEIFVFSLDAANDLTRVYPGSCRHSVESQLPASARRAYRFPEKIGDVDRGTIYAIAVNGSQLKQRFSRLLNDLPDACTSVDERPMTGRELEDWLRRLDRLIAQNSHRVAWSLRRLP